MGTDLAPAFVPIHFLVRDGAGAATTRRLDGMMAGDVMAGVLDGG
jgi:hypothetical protein